MASLRLLQRKTASPGVWPHRQPAKRVMPRARWAPCRAPCLMCALPPPARAMAAKPESRRLPFRPCPSLLSRCCCCGCRHPPPSLGTPPQPPTRASGRRRNPPHEPPDAAAAVAPCLASPCTPHARLRVPVPRGHVKPGPPCTPPPWPLRSARARPITSGVEPPPRAWPAMAGTGQWHSTSVCEPTNAASPGLPAPKRSREAAPAPRRRRQ